MIKRSTGGVIVVNWSISPPRHYFEFNSLGFQSSFEVDSSKFFTSHTVIFISILLTDLINLEKPLVTCLEDLVYSCFNSSIVLLRIRAFVDAPCSFKHSSTLVDFFACFEGYFCTSMMISRAASRLKQIHFSLGFCIALNRLKLTSSSWNQTCIIPSLTSIIIRAVFMNGRPKIRGVSSSSFFQYHKINRK